MPDDTTNEEQDTWATVTFRLPEDLKSQMETQAKAEERSLSAWLRFHLGNLLATN